MLGVSLKIDAGQAVRWESRNEKGSQAMGSLVIVLLLSLVLAFGQSVQTSSVCTETTSWFPLKVGARWIYENEWRTGDPKKPEITRWTSEEIVTSVLNVREGIVVVRMHTQHGQSRGGYVTARDALAYLVHQNCAYLVDKSAWDGTRVELGEEYRENLKSGTLVPEFCFPLQIGNRYGTRDLTWHVDGIGSRSDSFSPSGYADAYHIISDHFGSGGQMEVWFEKGIGIVAEQYVHSGTYEAYTKRLRRFIPAPTEPTVDNLGRDGSEGVHCKREQMSSAHYS